MSVEDNTDTASQQSTTVDESTGVDAEVTPGGETAEATTDTTEEAPESTETKEEESTSEDPTKEAATDDTASDLPDELYFNGEQVQLDIPDELQSSLSDAGVDVNKVVGELYGKDSDFTLSDETRAPLDEKYGKAVVDTFLGALKQQNDSVLKGAKDAATQAEEANKQAAEWSNEVVGGEEEWDAMAGWAEKALDEGELASFNKAMASGDKWMQELAIKSLHSKFKASEGDTEATLITADSSGSDNSDNSPMSSQDYMDAMISKDFMALGRQEKHKAQQALDARRRAGQKRGL